MCQCTAKEYVCILLYLTALQTTDLVACCVGCPCQEIKESIHYMTVEPCDRSRNATEDDLMRNKLVYIINIKTMISSCPQSIEPFGKCIGNRLFGILIHPCGNPDRNNRNYNACDSYRQIEVNRVRLSIRTDKMSERNEPCTTSNNR